MTNFLLGLISLTIIFNSCSNNDDTTAPVNQPVKKLYLTKAKATDLYDPDNQDTIVVSYEYDSQGQVVKFNHSTGNWTFEYSNGKPVKVNQHSIQSPDSYSVLTYNGDQLINFKTINANQTTQSNESYTYNASGKLTTYQNCFTDDCSPDSTTSNYTYNGNNISESNSIMVGMLNSVSKTQYSYDDKFNPYTNVNQYIRLITEGPYNYNKNNILTEKRSYLRKSTGAWIESGNTTYTIQYNSSGFPVQALGKDADGNNIIRIDYEYMEL